MKIYWDTSAVINAFMSDDVRERLDVGEHVTRLHTFGEFFAHITGRGIRFVDKATGENVLMKLTPDECEDWLREFSKSLTFCELTPEDLMDGLSKAQSRSIQGAAIYDYWHALAAQKAEADILLTRNTDDFKNLAPNVQWP